MTTMKVRTVRRWRLWLARRLLGIPAGVAWTVDTDGTRIFGGPNWFDTTEFLEFR